MSSFTAMFFLGVGSAIIGAASRNIGLSPFQIGLLLATQNIGFILSVITVGILADSADKTRLLFAAIGIVGFILALTHRKQLAIVSTADGKLLEEFRLDGLPVYDGMSAAYGMLFLSLEDGRLLCFGPDGDRTSIPR